jgi:hypothetical protein
MDDWPDSLHDVVAVIGRQKTIQLVDNLPPCGSRSWRRCLYVPAELTPDHKLVGILGEDDAKSLVDEFKGMVLHLATGKKEKIRLRNKKIRRLARLGLSTHQIASRVSVSSRYVCKILKKQRTA